MNRTWSQIQDILSKTIAKGQFQLWIKPLKAEIEGDSLLLTAPNEFVASWVKDRLYSQIVEAASAALGFKPKVKVWAESPPGREQANIDSGVKKKVYVLRRNKTDQMGLPLASATNSAPRPTWHYSFEDFVVAPCNELAHAAAKGLCSRTLGSEQLFISSTPGLGKTHLIQAVGAQLSDMSNKERPRVAYLTAEEFSRQMVFALRAKEIERFKAKYRECVDILLLEDIHFFQGKEKLQDELLSTLKALQEKGAKVIFSSSFLPRELKGVDSHLASRFCSGLLAVIDKPDFQTRKKILEQKARKIFRTALPGEVSDLLADRIRSDVRQLESCLQSLILKAKLLNSKLSVEMASQVIEHYAAVAPILNLDAIVDFICDSFELSQKQLASKSRQRQIVMARNTAFYLARQHTELSLQEIGIRFNRRHSTVLKGIANVEREINLETPLGRQLSRTVDMAGRYVQKPCK